MNKRDKLQALIDKFPEGKEREGTEYYLGVFNSSSLDEEEKDENCYIGLIENTDSGSYVYNIEDPFCCSGCEGWIDIKNPVKDYKPKNEEDFEYVVCTDICKYKRIIKNCDFECFSITVNYPMGLPQNMDIKFIGNFSDIIDAFKYLKENGLVKYKYSDINSLIEEGFSFNDINQILKIRKMINEGKIK